jgi:hypothetical protein
MRFLLALPRPYPHADRAALLAVLEADSNWDCALHIHKQLTSRWADTAARAAVLELAVAHVRGDFWTIFHLGPHCVPRRVATLPIDFLTII